MSSETGGELDFVPPASFHCRTVCQPLETPALVGKPGAR
jgi:hypothetical protein